MTITALDHNNATLTELLSFASKAGASDLHLSANQAPRLRIDGDMIALNLTPLDDEAVLALLKSVMDDAQWQHYQACHDVDFGVSLTLNDAKLARFRVNAYRQQHGAAAVFRLIPSAVPHLSSLNLDSDSLLNLQAIAKLRQGLVLVTGATGSGKSTTLAAIINEINQNRPAHILTLEDPIEFIHTPNMAFINQRQIGSDSESFASALRASLREDPDVILVGELRDLQSIQLALTAAETGHLVLATLHSRSAVGAIDRLVDVFAPTEKALIRTMLAESLQAVIAQSLLPKQGGGRIAALEIMQTTPAIRHLIRENKPAQITTAMQTGKAQGMITLTQSLDKLLARGLISQSTYDKYAQ